MPTKSQTKEQPKHTTNTIGIATASWKSEARKHYNPERSAQQSSHMGACQSIHAVTDAPLTGKAAAENPQAEILSVHSGRTTPTHLSMLPSIPRTHSAVGLDVMVEELKAEGNFVSNIVHIEGFSGRKIEQVYDGVHDGKELGKGVAGVVRLITYKETGTPYAVKCLRLSLVRSSVEAQQALRNEIVIMSQLDHPNIARLQEVYEDEHSIYLVQELGSGGELFDVLGEQPDYRYEEDEAVRLMFQIVSALRYLNSKGIIHRDLKLENFLFSTTRHKQLKMIDFGLSKHFVTGDIQHEQVGTPYTVAPEVLSGNYDEKCDIWAIGVIAFMFLSGETPFGGCGDSVSDFELRDNIRGCRYHVNPDEVLAEASPEARDFIQKMLACKPTQRPSAEEALRHPWLRAYHTKTTEGATVHPHIVQSLLAFKELHAAKRLMLEVVSFCTLPEQIRDLRIEFEKMDTDCLGEISLDSMMAILPRTSLANGRSISEPEIREVFDAMKVGKAETRVHWHEFIAACLPECHVDDSNFRIAFDRLDQNHNGFIAFEDVIELISRDADEDYDEMRSAWEEVVEECNCQRTQLSFDEFRQLVKQYV